MLTTLYHIHRYYWGDNMVNNNVIMKLHFAFFPFSRPTPPVRPRRQISNNIPGGSPAPPPKPAPYSPSTLERRMGGGGGGTGGRTPQRKAPPPPIASRQSKPHFNVPAPPPSAPDDEEWTKL